MKTLTVLLIVGLFVVVGVFVSRRVTAKIWGPHKTMSFERFEKHIMPRLKKKLALSDKQEQQVRGVLKTHFDRGVVLREKIRNSQSQLSLLLKKDPVDEQALKVEMKRFRSLVDKFSGLIKSLLDQSEEILTPVQQAKLATMAGKHRRHHRRGYHQLRHSFNPSN